MGMGRRTKKVVHKKNGSDDTKLKMNLNKVGCRHIGSIQEVNFFPTEGDLYHFEKCDCKAVCGCFTPRLDWPRDEHHCCFRNP